MASLTSKEKRYARILALQGIYAYEISGSDPKTTYKHMLDDTVVLKKQVIDYGKKLCDLTIDKVESIDGFIKNKSRNWDLNRIALIDKLILRMSLSEMLYIEEVPPKVSITEGVEIAKEFSTNDSSSFVNGILDSIYNDLMKGEIKI
tara:strand:- start:2031 stop:2471 length:441 start_codon:yes stop_codon:yes gene_type:complete